MRKITSIFLTFTILLTSIIIMPVTAMAEGINIYNLEMSFTFNQKQVYEDLEVINEFRTNPETAWYWNRDDITKTYCNDLPELKWDSRLEELAMQRAAECNILFDHTRPNGTYCYDISSYFGSENLGMNGDVVMYFENDEWYNRQGHRRNILDNSFNSIGIARCGGFTAQVFGSIEGDGKHSDFVGEKTFNIEVSPEYFIKSKTGVSTFVNNKELWYNNWDEGNMEDGFTNKVRYDMELYDNVNFRISPELNAIEILNYWSYGYANDDFYWYFVENDGVVEYNKNQTPMNVFDDTLTAKKIGTAKIHAVFDIDYIHRELDLTINVNPINIANKNVQINLDNEQLEYNKDTEEYTPAINSLSVEGVELTADDYDIEYFGNKKKDINYLKDSNVLTSHDAGVWIFFKNNYTGVTKKTFDIICNHKFKTTNFLGNQNGRCVSSTTVACEECGTIKSKTENKDNHQLKKVYLSPNEVDDIYLNEYTAYAEHCAENNIVPEFTFDEYLNSSKENANYYTNEFYKNKCNACGYEEPVVHKNFANEPHVFTTTYNNDSVPATCLKDGHTASYVKHCEKCGLDITVQGDIIPATGEHNINSKGFNTNYIEVIPNSCTENGSITLYGDDSSIYNKDDYICIGCGKDFSMEVPELNALNHNIVTEFLNDNTYKVEHCLNKTNTIVLNGSDLLNWFNGSTIKTIVNTDKGISLSFTFNNQKCNESNFVFYNYNNSNINGMYVVSGNKLINMMDPTDIKDISVEKNGEYTTITTNLNAFTLFPYYDLKINDYIDDNCNITISYDNCNIETASELDHCYKATNEVKATCEKSGYIEYTCLNCNHSYSETINPISHNYIKSVVSPTCSKQGYDMYICSMCGDKFKNNLIEPNDNHDIVTDKGYNPTCTSTGLTDGSHCSVCNKVITKQEIIEATGHKFQNISVVEATCTTDGHLAYQKCSTCGFESVYEVVKATGHYWDDGVVTKVPTCTSKGVRTYTCNRCSSTRTKELPLLSHNSKTVTTKATTSKDGKITTTCTVCEKILKTTTIKKVSTVKLSTSSYTYDGKVKSPTITVKDSSGKALVKGTDYTVTTPNGRKNVGKYTYKVTFKGNYSGTKSLSFIINPKGTSISSLTAASKGFTVKWKKQATQTTGYQIQYATDSKFSSPKTVTFSKNSNTSKTVSKLKAKKKYYVRVRTYKTINGTKYYSSWSSVKSVTTK